MNIRNSAFGIVLAVSLIGVAGCGSGDSGTAESPETETSSAEETPSEEETSAEAAEEESEEPEAAAEIVITIVDFAYEMPDSVPAGAEITVVNEDAVAHTETSEEGGLFDAVVQPGESVTFTAPEEPGEYPFVCTFHGNMMDTLVVTDS